ncbi:MAG TPA: DUF3048 domain-containing protein [Thermodesulfobacteriota bacterium]|nr:DUF3048 domain-containing protein [Thermodesulfobacteriota bacterium]
MPFQTDDLVCPDCHDVIVFDVKDDQGALACIAGHGPWPVENGIVRFTASALSHENRWISPCREWNGWEPWGWVIRRNSHWGIPHLLRPMLARPGRYPLQIVDLGCGGGWEFLTGFGHVTGVDYRTAALKSAASLYDRVILSSVDKLPFADNSADVVVSIWLFEHLPERQFVATLREVRRILRPGGRLIFFTDLDSSKPILRWAKQFPELYARHHVDAVGHHGLRSLRYTKFLLQREGFVENETVAVNKSSLLQPVTALWMFNNELGRKSLALRLYLLGCKMALKSRLLYRPLYLLLMEYHRLADRWLPETFAFSAAFDWILPETHGASISVITKKAKVVSDKGETDPWCGLPVSEENRGRRPVAVMLDNSGRSHPQRGLASASLVIGAPVEGGLTRLMPVFSRDFNSVVGPVRSARPYFIDWAEAFQPFFVHCGGSPEARIRLEHPEQVIDLECLYRQHETGQPEVIQNAPILVTEDGRTPPHHIFVLPRRIFDKLYELKLNLPQSLEESRINDPDSLSHYCPELQPSFRDEPAHNEEISKGVRVLIHSHPGAPYPEQFDWDKKVKGFRRSVLNTPMGEDATRDPNLIITNLVLVWVPTTRIPGDVKGRLRINTCGEGPAQVWCGPHPEEATWHKIHSGGPLQFRDIFGNPFILRRGLTWIYALPEEAIVSVMNS